jgi:hypothetical protein
VRSWCCRWRCWATPCRRSLRSVRASSTSSSSRRRRSSRARGASATASVRRPALRFRCVPLGSVGCRCDAPGRPVVAPWSCLDAVTLPPPMLCVAERGTMSLLYNTLRGVGLAASGISGSVGHGTAYLSFDQEYIRRRQRRALTSRTVGLSAVVYEGAKDVVRGFGSAVAGGCHAQCCVVRCSCVLCAMPCWTLSCAVCW